MCLPDFVEFRQVDRDNPIKGYRNWNNKIEDSNDLESINQKYIWMSDSFGPHEVLESNSGIYSYNYYYNYYNNYNNNYNNYYNYYYNNNYYNNNYNNNYYYIGGIIFQWGKVAIHKTGYRSEYAQIDTLFSIRESDAKGPKKFLDWIKTFNQRINNIAQKYNCKVISWQDFKEGKQIQG
jgi:hypothetical protein